MTFEGQVADALVNVYESQKATIIPELQALEGGTEALIENAANNLKIANPFEAALYNALKPAIIAELKQMEAANPGSVLYGLIDTGIHNLAKSLGG